MYFFISFLCVSLEGKVLGLHVFLYSFDIDYYIAFVHVQSHYQDLHAKRPICQKLEDHMTLGVRI